MSVAMNPDLKAKRVLVTGASNETGPVVARLFAARGASLALTYCSDRAGAKRTAEACRSAGAPRAESFHLDLLDNDSCSALVPAVVDALGGVDILVAVAGAGASYTPLTELSPDAFVNAFRGQVAGTFVVARDAGLVMPDDGSASIVLVSATSCYKNAHAGYGFAKAALNELTRFLAFELSARKVRVNTLVPQLIDLETISEDIKATRRRFTPLGNIPHPEEIGRMALALCAPLFRTVTGQLIYMDGGYRLRPPEDR